MELADARKAARAKRTLVDAGRDPLLEKQSEIDAQLKASAAKKARGKFKELAEDWYETEIKGARLKHPAVPRRYLDKYMLPEFGDTVPADITPAMAARLLARVGKKAPTAANDLLRYMRRVFRFAVRRHLMASSPVADFNLSDAGGQESARQRSLRKHQCANQSASTVVLNRSQNTTGPQKHRDPHREYSPNVAETSSLRSQFVTSKTGRVRILEICT
jgi:hypothetical protein